VCGGAKGLIIDGTFVMAKRMVWVHVSISAREGGGRLLQCVAECCSVLQGGAGGTGGARGFDVLCSVLQCVAVCCRMLQCVAGCCSELQCVAVCCRILQDGAVCCSLLQCDAICCSVSQCVAVCCSVLQ